MGREVRMVPASWRHPKDERGDYVPLHAGYALAKQKFEEMQSEKGLQEALEYFGVAPNADEYMPDWPESECTHFQMYETTSEGKPLGPPMPTPEALAQWLFENKASAFGNMTASYDGWLRVARGGYAPSAVYTGGVGLESGVDGL